jgi:PAS domain S-box-containing protein
MDTPALNNLAIPKKEAAHPLGDLFDMLPDAYLILDAEFSIVRTNQRYLNLTNQARPALIGQSIFALNQFGSAAHLRLRERWLTSALKNVRPGRSISSGYFRYDVVSKRTDDGKLPTERYWKIKLSMLTLPGAAGHCFALRLSDVTTHALRAKQERLARVHALMEKRRQQDESNDAAERLRDQSQRLEYALRFARLGAWELDPMTGIILCTDSCKANFGVPADEILTEARLFEDIMDPRDRAHVRENMRRALASGIDFTAEHRVIWPNKSVRWILVQGYGQHRANGSLLKIIGYTLDITERKEAQLAHHEAVKSEQDNRRQSEQRAIETDHFVSAVSHELRSPLNAILAWVKLIQRAPDSERGVQAMAVIDRSARQLSLMVDDLLDTGAIAAGKLSVQLRPLDLGALTVLVTEEMRPAVEEKHFELITTNIAPCMIQADESRMRQVIWNVLNNAMKFGETGKITVSVTHDPTHATLAITDDGIGIEASRLDEIFNRFRQSTDDDSGRMGGLGLGLWLAKNIVGLHGGTLHAESAGLGKGATFVVRLPITR